MLADGDARNSDPALITLNTVQQYLKARADNASRELELRAQELELQKAKIELDKSRLEAEEIRRRQDADDQRKFMLAILDAVKQK